MPIFQQGGWFDPYSGSHLRSFAAIGDRVPNRVLIGPWSHEEEVETFRGDVDLSAVADRDPRPRARLLRPLPQGRAATTGTSGRRSSSSCSARTSGAASDEWPLAGHRATRRGTCAAGGDARAADARRAADEPADRYAYDPADPVPTIGGVNSVLTMTQGAADAGPPGPDRPARARGAATTCSCYTSDKLDHDLEVIGPVEMVLYAASSAQRHRLHRPPLRRLPRRPLDLHHRGDHPRALPQLERGRLDRAARAGRGRRVPDPLLPDGERFKKGHRIRLDVTSSSFPRFSRNLNTGEDVGTGTRMEVARQTVLHTAAYPSHVRAARRPPVSGSFDLIGPDGARDRVDARARARAGARARRTRARASRSTAAPPRRARRARPRSRARSRRRSTSRPRRRSRRASRGSGRSTCSCRTRA